MRERLLLGLTTKAGLTELADVGDLKSSGRKAVGVRFPRPAPIAIDPL